MAKQTVRIIGVPMDLGQSRRGVDMGPSAVRYANLKARLERLGHTVLDEGNISVPNPEESVAQSGEKRLQAVTAVCNQIFQKSQNVRQPNDFVIYLGGDHSISIGSVAAVSYQKSIGVIWVDAHGDFNTHNTSHTGNIHGMPVAALLGEGHPSLVNAGFNGRKIKPDQIIQIGIRDLDERERERLAQSGISVYTMRHIDERGMAAIAKQTLEQLRGFDHIHVSLDMDSLDPREAPGVGTPVPGGLTYREAHLLMEILGDSRRVRSLDIVEINPILDQHNKTADLAVELAASLLGKRIL